MKFNLFGDRIAISHIEEELVGTIVLADTRNKSHGLAKVVAVGNGKIPASPVYPDGQTQPIHLAVGDVVVYQINPAMAFNCQHKIEGKAYMVLGQRDIVAKLTSAKVSFADFQPIGRYAIARAFEDVDPNSTILLPENAEKKLRYILVKKGDEVKGVEIDDELVVENQRMQLVMIENDPYFYTDCGSIAGIIEGAVEIKSLPFNPLAAAKKNGAPVKVEVTRNVRSTTKF